MMNRDQFREHLFQQKIDEPNKRQAIIHKIDAITNETRDKNDEGRHQGYPHHPSEDTRNHYEHFDPETAHRWNNDDDFERLYILSDFDHYPAGDVHNKHPEERFLTDMRKRAVVHYQKANRDAARANSYGISDSEVNKKYAKHLKEH